MVTGANRDAFAVERLADVLRPAAVDHERDHASALARAPIKRMPGSTSGRDRLPDQLVLVGRDRLEPDRVEVVDRGARPTRRRCCRCRPRTGRRA